MESIESAKCAKAVLEKAILDMVKDYEQRYAVQVGSIDLYHSKTIGLGQTLISVVLTTTF